MAPFIFFNHRKPFSPRCTKHDENKEIDDNYDISHVFILGKYMQIN